MGNRDEDVRELVATIWETLFAQPVNEGGPVAVGDLPLVSSYVAIEGTWQGGILIEMPVELARRLTARFLGLESSPSTEQTGDAMGELCNIVAGNFKALVPGPSHLSLPVVTLGSDYHVKVVGAMSARSVAFSADGYGFVVTVHEGPGPV